MLVDEMREAFRRSEEFLDLEKGEVPPLKQKEISKEKLGNLTQEELELLQKLLAKINDNKKDDSNENQEQIKQNK
jgi:hypothetical protein